MKSKEKVVQTTLSPEEHAILLDYATQHDISIKEAVKRAILNLLKSDTIILRRLQWKMFLQRIYREMFI